MSEDKCGYLCFNPTKNGEYPKREDRYDGYCVEKSHTCQNPNRCGNPYRCRRRQAANGEPLPHDDPGAKKSNACHDTLSHACWINFYGIHCGIEEPISFIDRYKH